MPATQTPMRFNYFHPLGESLPRLDLQVLNGIRNRSRIGQFSVQNVHNDVSRNHRVKALGVSDLGKLARQFQEKWDTRSILVRCVFLIRGPLRSSAPYVRSPAVVSADQKRGAIPEASLLNRLPKYAQRV